MLIENSHPQRPSTAETYNSSGKMSFIIESCLELWNNHALTIIAALACYLVTARALRYLRMAKIEAPFVNGRRPLSSMTVSEAQTIITQLQELEFPRAFAKARRMALLKVRTSNNKSDLWRWCI